MTAAHPAIILPRGVPLRRMLIALGASLLLHFLLVGSGGSGATHTNTTAIVAPLQARLESVPAALPPSVAVDSLPINVEPQAAIPSRRTSPITLAATTLEPSPAVAATSGLDLRFYLARELDQYPSPLSVLGLDRGTIRLWVSIDQTGRVVDAAVIDADPPGEFERQAREQLLATRFVPAQREGRPVKSRILLVLGRGA